MSATLRIVGGSPSEAAERARKLVGTWLGDGRHLVRALGLAGGEPWPGWAGRLQRSLDPEDGESTTLVAVTIDDLHRMARDLPGSAAGVEPLRAALRASLEALDLADLMEHAGAERLVLGEG